jgi:hypothetical protein
MLLALGSTRLRLLRTKAVLIYRLKANLGAMQLLLGPERRTHRALPSHRSMMDHNCREGRDLMQLASAQPFCPASTIKSVEISATLLAHSVEKRTSDEHSLARLTRQPPMSAFV